MLATRPILSMVVLVTELLCLTEKTDGQEASWESTEGLRCLAQEDIPRVLSPFVVRIAFRLFETACGLSTGVARSIPVLLVSPASHGKYDLTV